MKIQKMVKRWLIPTVLLLLGVGLVFFSQYSDRKRANAFDLYREAMATLESSNFEGAYTMFLQSSSEFEDPHLKAIAIYEAANIGWAQNLADYKTLVELYKQALRYEPGFREASFNLELLYWLKANKPEELPQPSEAGEMPAEGGDSNGDI